MAVARDETGSNVVMTLFSPKWHMKLVWNAWAYTHIKRNSRCWSWFWQIRVCCPSNIVTVHIKMASLQSILTFTFLLKFSFSFQNLATLKNVSLRGTAFITRLLLCYLEGLTLRRNWSSARQRLPSSASLLPWRQPHRLCDKKFTACWRQQTRSAVVDWEHSRSEAARCVSRLIICPLKPPSSIGGSVGSQESLFLLNSRCPR